MRYTLLMVVSALAAGCTGLRENGIPVAPTVGARAVVFDIDGTLTPGVYALNEARPDAAAAVRAYFDRGYEIIYLSTRVSFLQKGIPAWLKGNGFPEGSIHVALTDAEHNSPAAFKGSVLKEFVARGWRLTGGYGDSSTDFAAYAEAGIPRSQVFAMLRRGRSNCETGQWRACLRSWTEHLSFIASSPD